MIPPQIEIVCITGTNEVIRDNKMEKEIEIEKLKKQNEALKKRLRESYETISRLEKSISRQYHYNQDYIPYPDEDDRR